MICFSIYAASSSSRARLERDCILREDPQLIIRGRDSCKLFSTEILKERQWWEITVDNARQSHFEIPTNASPSVVSEITITFYCAVVHPLKYKSTW